MNKIKYFLFLLFLISKISVAVTLEVKTLAIVNNAIITDEDVKIEKIILKYLFNNDDQINNKIAMKNLIEQNIKKKEIVEKYYFISESETVKFMNLILKKSNKSLEDFRNKFNNKIYENFLKEKIKIEMTWNKYMIIKFSNEININVDEIIAKSLNTNLNQKSIEEVSSEEKNKKLNILADTYLNELINNSLIKIL